MNSITIISSIIIVLSFMKILSIRNKYNDNTNWPLNLDIADMQTTRLYMLSALFFSIISIGTMFVS